MIGGGGDRLAPARVSLHGPITRMRLDCGALGETILVGELLPGEVRRWVVPLPGIPLGGASPGIEVSPDGGRVTFEGILDASDQVPPEWGYRSLPPVDASAASPDPVALICLAAAALAVFAARKRAWVALGLGLLGAALVAGAQLHREGPAAESTRVLEGDAESGRWMVVEGAWEELALDPNSDRAIECEPERLPLTYRGEFTASGVGWRVHLRGGRLWRRAGLEPGSRRLDPMANLWGTMSETWTRGSDGSWSVRGVWPLGAPLPDPKAGGAGPPGWLAAGLSQGRSVLVARLAEDSWAGESVGDRIPSETWLRLVGFDLGQGR